MKLPFSEISQEARSFSYSGAGWFPEEEVECVGSPQVVITAGRKGKKVLLDGMLGFTALLSCDRCGKPVESMVEEEFEYILPLMKLKVPNSPRWNAVLRIVSLFN